MDESSSDNESLNARIQQLEQERDALHKDIEQLCMQNAGPEYVNYATQTYFRRTAGLEQEVENLKKKLADSAKTYSDIKDELSEAKRIKTYLDQLHKMEVSKNTEINKQLEYWRGVVAEAFSDRDTALMEAERAKENEELMSQKLNDAETRLQEVSEGFTETQEQVMYLQMKLEKQELELDNYRTVINKFYNVRQHASGCDEDEESIVDHFEDVSWDEKCACLSHDPSKLWSFNAPQESSANDIAAVQEELETLRGSIFDLQTKLRMGMEIENHLKRRISFLEQKKVLSDRLVVDGISSLREYYRQQRTHVMELLEDEKSYLQSVAGSIEQKIGKLHTHIHPPEVPSSSMPKLDLTADSSEALARALQEKVSALVLLSQQEERHIWEKSVDAAVHETVDELQTFLKLASEEKVNALVELAEVKQQYQLLLEKAVHETPQGSRLAGSGEGRSFKSLLMKTSKHLFGSEDTPLVLYPKLEREGSSNNLRSNNAMDANARLRVEYANLKDSMHSLERLIYDIRKLRLSLLKAKMTASSKGTSKQLDDTIREAELLKIALSSALPLSWSEGDVATSSGGVAGNPFDEGANSEKIDPVSAAGLEMVELLILASQIMKEKRSKREPRSK